MGHGYTDIPIPPGCGVPPVSRRGVDAAFETATAAFTGLTDYWTTALLQARSPVEVALDGLRWWEIMTERRRPRWATRHRIVRRTPLTRLRDFTPADPADVVPTLVLPPQAGHDSCIVDFSTEQSQMRTIRAVGLERLYALEWVGATPATKDATVADELAEVAAAVDHIGGPVNLVGDCQGGWLATIYAALHPENVNTLTIAGAPIDFHAGDAVIHESVEALSNVDMNFFRSLVALGDGVLKGDFLLGGFIVIKPENELAKQLQLLARLGEERHVSRYRAFEDWYKHTQDLPGPFYLWLVEHLFRDNELVKGTLQIDGQAVDLGRISCPINLMAGNRDHITPPEQVFALADHVATPPEDILGRTTEGGHLGLFMGTEALRDHWPVVMSAVLERSHGGHDRRAAERRGRHETARARAIPAP
jgi:poly(3-hydroxybutyrate) depolymerase